VYKVLEGKNEGKRPLEDPEVDRRIIMKCIVRKVGWEGSLYTGLI
jgi:hypothetical protein